MNNSLQLCNNSQIPTAFLVQLGLYTSTKPAFCNSKTERSMIHQLVLLATPHDVLHSKVDALCQETNHVIFSFYIRTYLNYFYIIEIQLTTCIIEDANKKWSFACLELSQWPTFCTMSTEKSNAIPAITSVQDWN